MAKRIVYCADGSWQTERSGTNVYKLYKALTLTADQVTFYDDGIGVDGSRAQMFLGGAAGFGLVEKVLAGYTKIAHVYEAGDEIFLFGFSRGAYTARSMAGMIASCGLPTGKFDDSSVTKAFEAYRDRANRSAILAGLTASGLGDATVRMVGVWDTVGSLGIPAAFGKVDEKNFGFLDTGLHPDVKNAFHAMSIDEHRQVFPATLWTGKPAPGQTIEQVWFPGCHGNVGGGTPLTGGVDGSTRLSDIPLSWMMGKATSVGLTFDPTVFASYQNLPATYALDGYVDSYPQLPLGPPTLRPILPDAHIANSVTVRLKYALTYAPANLKIEDGVLADTYTVVNVVDENAF